MGCTASSLTGHGRAPVPACAAGLRARLQDLSHHSTHHHHDRSQQHTHSASASDTPSGPSLDSHSRRASSQPDPSSGSTDFAASTNISTSTSTRTTSGNTTSTSGSGAALLTRIQARPALLSSFNRLSCLAAQADTPLHTAAEAGQLELVRALLRYVAGEHGGAGEGDGAAPLQTVREALRPACRRAGAQLPATRGEALAVLVNMPNSKGQTPLMHACSSGHAAVAQLLLEHGADPWVGDRCGSRTALHYAAMAGSVRCINLLLEERGHGLAEDSGSDGSSAAEGVVGAQPLPEQADDHHHHQRSLELVRNNIRYVNVRSSCGLVPLHYAVCYGHLEAVRSLLAHGPLLSAASRCTSYDTWVSADPGSTPLHFAALKGDAVLALELVRYYALRRHTGSVQDPRMRPDADGRVPWQVAAQRRHDTDLARLLHPATPLGSLFGDDEAALERERCGAPRLADIAAAALRSNLVASVSKAMAQVQGQPEEEVECGGAVPCGRRAAGPEEEDSEDDDTLCQLCFERYEQVAPSRCGHRMCGACARELCGSVAASARPLLCPFCRSPVAAFMVAAPAPGGGAQGHARRSGPDGGAAYSVPPVGCSLLAGAVAGSTGVLAALPLLSTSC